jgi:HTH-type transcriptional regulator/antitoxin HigA
MKLKLIKSEEEYQKALKRLDKIFHAKKGTKEQEELEILVMLIQRYEDETVGEFPDPDPIEAIKFKMEQMEMTQKDLAEVIGLKSRASEILSRKRPMSINIIRKISTALSIPADILIQPYKLCE